MTLEPEFPSAVPSRMRQSTFMPLWSVSADVSRLLTEAERTAIADALDDIVEGGGCVGLQKGTTDEIYFVVDLASEEAARAEAIRCVDLALRKANVSISYVMNLRRY
jgi:hypothetical protein